MNSVIRTTPKPIESNLEPVLHKVLKEAKKEHRELQQMFTLMGWGELPDALKVEIKDDVAAMVKELCGSYSSCDPFVARRRRRVVYWVECFMDRVCTLETAIEALRIKKL